MARSHPPQSSLVLFLHSTGRRKGIPEHKKEQGLGHLYVWSHCQNFVNHKELLSKDFTRRLLLKR